MYYIFHKCPAGNLLSKRAFSMKNLPAHPYDDETSSLLCLPAFPYSHQGHVFLGERCPRLHATKSVSISQPVNCVELVRQYGNFPGALAPQSEELCRDP